MAPTVIRSMALVGIAGTMGGAVISALRGEEIFLICPITWLMALGKIIALPSYGFQVIGWIIIGACLLLMAIALASAIFCSGALCFVPSSKILLVAAALSYATIALGTGLPLVFIFSNGGLSMLMKNANGPPLSHLYGILPILWIACSIGLFTAARNE
jgi:hypothetical protein